MPRANDWASRSGPRVPVRPSSTGQQQSGSSSPQSPKLPDQRLSVLFCCLGNICRSTMAEGVFQSLTRNDPRYKDRIGRIDSCGTASYHTGERPDARTMATLEANGITDYVHSARKVNNKDFDTFDYIFAMDRSNLSDLERMRKDLKRLKGTDCRAKVMLFGEFSGTGKVEVINDPYYGGNDGFELAYRQAVRFSENFLKERFPDTAEASGAKPAAEADEKSSRGEAGRGVEGEGK